MFEVEARNCSIVVIISVLMNNIIDRSITHYNYNTIIINYLLFHRLIYHPVLCYYYSSSLSLRSFPSQIKRETAPVARDAASWDTTFSIVNLEARSTPKKKATPKNKQMWLRGNK